MVQSKEKNFVSAVIYVHNAENTIEDFLKIIIGTLENNFEHSEIICVNDASCDDSRKKIEKLNSITNSTSLSVVNMSCFHGIELAMNAGMDLSIGDYVFEFDNTVPDFNPEEIMRAYNRALEGFDIVSAVPDRKERFSSRIFYAAFDKYANQKCKMHTESFRILSRRVINRIASMNKTVPYRKAIYATTGLKTDQLIYKAADVKIAYDKQVRGYRFSLAVDSLILFTEAGYRFSMAMALLMLLLAGFMLIYTVVIYLTMHPIAGWTTTILFLSVTFFGLFIILAVIIRYLQIIVNLVFRRKHYSFESIEKFTK